MQVALEALALEYKLDNGLARRNVDVLDFVNDPNANGVCRVLSLGFEKQGLDLRGVKMRALLDDRAYALLVGKHVRKRLP